MHRWTKTEKAKVLRLRAAGFSWLETHKRLGLQVSRRALRHKGYKLGVAKRPRYNPHSRVRRQRPIAVSSPPWSTGASVPLAHQRSNNRRDPRL
jgi:hypothetical protein